MFQAFRTTVPGLLSTVFLATATLAGACSSSESRRSPPETSSSVRPSILLVTLDTTRADAIGPGAEGADTPAFNALAARGRRFSQAYATVPETLPSHASMMTGLYPAGHGVHENARYLAGTHTVVAEELHKAGYRTAAFVSSFVLSRRFGLARGFDLYDDALPAKGAERSSRDTTDRAIAFLSRESHRPVMLWVHYFDPHTPYAPEEPFRSQFKTKPYHGEVAAMDRQLGRLVEAFERAVEGPSAIIVAGDHGEGLGDHGEAQHGNLLYQSTMRVPLVLLGPGIESGVSDTAVSVRRIYHTLRDWAGVASEHSLWGAETEVVLGEAMRPFLGYGWQPQIMAIQDARKAIFAGTLEVYDVLADPLERRNLGGGAELPPAVRKALDDYPVPSPETTRASEKLDPEASRTLASLGYVSATVPPKVRKNAPRPSDMAQLFPLIERASGLFVQERYAEVVPLLRKILDQDPTNLDAALRLATAYSSLGNHDQAILSFRRAAGIAPESPDVRTYLALHLARGKEWEKAVPYLERVLEETPDRLPAIEALATIRERQGRVEEAVTLRQKVYRMRDADASELVRQGRLAMSIQNTPVAIESFEKARTAQGSAFAHDLELGVLYRAARRLTDARDALDRVPATHPEYPMALFKRAQVSVLLNEPDSAARIDRARKHADATTRPLVEKEQLFVKSATR